MNIGERAASRREPPVDRAAAVDGLDALIRFVVRNTAALSGMSIASFSTLTSLSESGPLRITDLAAREGVSQPSMTTMVNRLERLGLVDRRVDPADGRSSRIAITDAGQEIRLRRRAGRSAFLTTLVDRLTDDDAADLERVAPILTRLTDRDALPDALAAARDAGAPDTPTTGTTDTTANTTTAIAEPQPRPQPTDHRQG